MDFTTDVIRIGVVFVGAMIGAVKATVEMKSGKPVFGKLVDVFVGLFFGGTLAYHLGNDQSIALAGVIALFGGVSGTIVVEVLLQMIPSIARRYIKRWVENKIKQTEE